MTGPAPERYPGFRRHARVGAVALCLVVVAGCSLPDFGSERGATDQGRDIFTLWGPSPLADQRSGAGILWVFGELLGVVAIALVVHQWMRHEERVAVRTDRRLDAERAAAGYVASDTVPRTAASTSSSGG